MLEVIKIVLRFLILIAVQVIVLNNIRLGGYVNPYMYVLFIMLLPVRIPKTLLLVLSFATGLTIDVFSNTLGMHAAATVFLGFVRPGILRAIAPRDGYEADASPSLKLGVGWFFLYTLLAVLLHHFVLFYVEVFRFTEFFSTLMRVVLSSCVTIVFIIISQFLFGKPTDDR